MSMVRGGGDVPKRAEEKKEEVGNNGGLYSRRMRLCT
jgi:hypothetical protein